MMHNEINPQLAALGWRSAVQFVVGVGGVQAEQFVQPLLHLVVRLVADALLQAHFVQHPVHFGRVAGRLVGLAALAELLDELQRQRAARAFVAVRGGGKEGQEVA